MTDKPAGVQVERWVTVASTILAPVTLLSTLLFYFGYVSSRAEYEYFGIDVDTIGLGTRDYVMRSPQPLLTPLLAFTLAGAGLLTLHAAVRKRAAAAVAEPDEGNAARPDTAAQGVARLARWSARTGRVVLGAGIALLLSYGYLRDWAYYNLLTPLLLAAGSALISYAPRIRRLLDPHPRQRPPTAADQGGPNATSPTRPDRLTPLQRTAGLLIYVVIAAGLFWTTATVAQWSGRGLAQYNAQHLTRLPSVILDTTERLYLRVPGIEETALPASDGQKFHYRYRHLRLLIQGGSRMFLVPERWSPSGTTLVIELDDAVRVQFQFQNQ